MKNFRNTLLVVLTFVLLVGCKTTKDLDKDTEAWRYQVEGVNTGTQGTYQIKVWTYAKEVAWAEAQTPKNAVHAVLFKGFDSNDRIKGQRPLINDVNMQPSNKLFFDSFFENGGEYAKYVTMVGSGEIGPGDLVKVGDEYKVGFITSVNVAELRRYLEQKNIIKKLDDGF
mgnify:CR=1 FL=1|tara:strand:+ start:1739 stop:2248 length:510 start_codon:yes stop_codon:yes gene_type:complete